MKKLFLIVVGLLFFSSSVYAAFPSLTVPQGGTGWGAIESGGILYGSTTLRIATTTQGTHGQILAWLSGIPSWTASTTFSTGLTYSGGNVTCDTASGSVFGCLAAADWTTFNSKESALTFTYPLTRATNTISLAFGTTTANTWAELQTFSSGVNVGGTTFTALIPTTRSLTIAGTANQISSSAGAQDLSANRTWTLSLPNHIIFPSSFQASEASTTNATTTSFAIASLISKLLKTDASGNVVGAVSGTDYEAPLTFNSPLSRSVNAVSFSYSAGAGMVAALDGSGNFISTSTPTAAVYNATSTTATSTFAHAIRSTCFSINGTSCLTSGATTPGGADTNVQFNDGSAFNGLASFTFLKASRLLTAENITATSTLLSFNTSSFGATATSTFDSTGVLTTPNAGLHMLDSDASHDLIFDTDSDLTADRILKFNTGDAARTLTVNGDATLNDWFDQSVKIAASPTFAALTLTAALTVPNGGSGAGTFTDHGVLVGSGTGAFTALSVGTNGQLLVGSSGADPVFATANCGTGLTCILGAGTFQIDVDDDYLLDTGDVGTGVYDFGGATSFEIPNGAAFSPTTLGQIAIDSTTGQVKYGDGSVTRILGNGYLYPAFSYSTSTAWSGTTTIPLGGAGVGETWSQAICFTDAGTVTVAFDDGTNIMTNVVASTTVGIQALTTNNTFTLAEKRYVKLGSPVSSPTQVSCTVRKAITAD